MPALPERVWLLRHAESAAPLVFNGSESDVDLSELGSLQAAAVGGWFVQHRPTAVVSSGLVRAIRTAAPIAAGCGVPHTIEPGLNERTIGALSGTPFTTHGGPWHETVAAWSAGNTAFTTEGAESFDDLVARLVPAWEAVCAAHPGGRVVVVAHGIVCKVLLLTLLDGHGPTSWGKLGRVANASVSELVPAGNGKWSAEKLLLVPDPVLAVAVTPGGSVA